ncbi:hypothetical protein OA006_00615 [Prochlorococcus sp. AH-736-D21]|nr:hypothetical protein [Prochlorococcus sp. AH-736-D21]
MKVEQKKILVIPMCGIGKRFKEEGFVDHKSMIKVNHLTMLERIINNFQNFSINFEIYLITTKSIFNLFNFKDDWQSIESKINVIFISDHKLGPAYSIYKSFSEIPKGLGTFISYCDITWEWKNGMQINEDTNAAIYCHYGFHPHLVKNNYSAFCRPSKKNKKKLNQIKEKESYSDDWMNEPLSIGLFYVKDISLIRFSLEKMIKDNIKVSNEFFPSLVFNYLVESKINVDLIPVESFVHYGTPAQLNDIKKWCNYFFDNKKGTIEKSNINLFPATIYTSGEGNRMKRISKKSKALIKVGEKKMIELIFEKLPLKNHELSIVYNSLDVPIKDLSIQTNYIKIDPTKSQFESLYNSAEHISTQNNFFLCSCDCFGFFDNQLLSELIEKNIHDIICFGFLPSLMQEKLECSFSTFSNSNLKLERIFVKDVNKYSNFGLAGFFWIRDGNLFSKYLKEFNEISVVKNRELIIDDVLEFCIKKDLSIGNIPLKQYIHLGTEEEYKEYEYWDQKINSLLKSK